MKEMEKAKKKYDAIPVPDELYTRVQKEIEREPEGKKEKGKVNTGYRWGRSAILAAAAAMVLFITALNTNTAFAKEISGIPVLGAVARVFTFRSYVEENEDLKVSVEIPSVEVIGEDTSGLADSVNREIYALCEQYADRALQRVEEYKKAFLETGGTQEEWEAHNIEIKVFYEIKSQTERYLSFTVTGTENWTSAYKETRYYNMDLQSEKLVTLKDILGEDYIRIANNSIQDQIKQRTEEGAVFFSQKEGGFTGISDDPNFYINELGNPVIVFEKYEIAPGSAGEVEFEIESNVTEVETVVEEPLQEEKKQEGTETTESEKESSSEDADKGTDSTEEIPESETGYEDNFAVDSEVAATFGRKVKETVAEQDINALADLASYPLYVGFEDGSVTAESREELIALGAEKIFTQELMESIKNTDENSLSPSMAGFALYTGDGPNIVFGVLNGRLAIQGINY
ncbi:MAG: DUF3298 domain-containing protein [Suilimivivens sp.]